MTVDKIADDITARLSDIEESKTTVTIPPPVRGMGGQTGFSMRLQNRANMTPAEFEKVANDFIAAANQVPGIRNVFTTFSTGTPQLYVDVDRDKAQMLHVPLEAIFEALRVYLGSAYVNDFNMFGRTFRVTAQADASFRMQPENVARIRVRNEIWANGAARQPRQFPQCLRPRPHAALQSVPDRRGERVDAGRRQHRAGADPDGRSRQERAARRASPTSGPTCRTRRRRSAAPAITSSRCR